MRRLRYDGILLSTALALTLVGAGTAVHATTQPDTEAAVAQPDSVDALPLPPSADDPRTQEAITPPPADPLASLDPADRPTAQSLQELVDKRLDRFGSRKNERDGIAAFYRNRNFAPLWTEKGTPAARTAAAIKFLGTVDTQGLDPIDYRTPDFAAATEPAARADAEIRMTLAVLTYARHAQTGRVHFSRIAFDVYYNLDAPEPAEVLAKLADAADVEAVLASFEPPHAGYKALKAKLAAARNQVPEPELVRVPDGPTMRPATNDPRVPLVRKRLKVAGDADSTKYDEAVVEAVKAFQREAGLPDDGLLGRNTVRAMNGGPKRGNQTDVIIANLERWRWVPRDLGKTHVMLNIPDFTLKVVNGDEVVWRTKVVVGKPSTPTPIMSDAMKFITVNPTWNVPPSIVYNEYLPALQQDPTVLSRMGLKLVQNRDGSVHIYQPPGDSNALGRLRFNFPNKFLVYQHDTPDKQLFKQTRRAYSHGCMRVENPVKYAEVLLSLALPQEGYTQERLRRMYGPSEQNINFPASIPVHLTYQTAYVDDAGELVIREDIYGRDARVLATLRGEDRKVADIAIERRPPSYDRPPVTLPTSYAYDNGPSFFERLFGFGRPPEPPQKVERRRRDRRTDRPAERPWSFTW
jgi:murein L,D-transpeptidase YcbB/YkuD